MHFVNAVRSLGVALALGLAQPGGAFAAPPVIAGPPETVFDWRTGRCATWDIPDTPARAWRGQDGRVRLIAGSEENRLSIGPDLDHLSHDCGIVHLGAEADDPAAYDDRAWIAATFTADGRRVEALAHVEYHGHLRPDRCPAGVYAACWRNAIVALESTDGGGSFSRAGLVAALPYRYSGAHGGRTGYFSPSNILRDGDRLYAFVFAEAYGAQKRGACLLRRPVAGSADDWRAWDGAAFTVRFVDPYREDVTDPARHVCTPVAGITSTMASVVRHQPSGRYLAVTPGTYRDSAGVERVGIHWTVSDDLIAWSKPRLLYAVPLLWRRDCGAPAVHAYPSLIDADSPSANFDSVDTSFWLYLVRMRLGEGCRVGPDRDLVRLPVSWPAP